MQITRFTVQRRANLSITPISHLRKALRTMQSHIIAATLFSKQARGLPRFTFLFRSRYWIRTNDTLPYASFQDWCNKHTLPTYFWSPWQASNLHTHFGVRGFKSLAFFQFRHTGFKTNFWWRLWASTPDTFRYCLLRTARLHFAKPPF